MDIQKRYWAIQKKFKKDIASLFKEVLETRSFQNGDRVQLVRDVGVGMPVRVAGVVVSGEVFLCGKTGSEYPRILYWVRVESPEHYNSHQECSRLNIEYGKAEDFWEGDTRWSRVE